MRILVVNAGSSSLKLRLLQRGSVVEHADLPASTEASGDVTADVVARWAKPDAIGHRVVHGGTNYRTPVLIDDEVRRRLEMLIPLAPLHQPKSLAGIDAMSRAFPGVPAVACFDTAFHATIGPEITTYPIPRQWRDDYGIRLYGFHGLSHAYASRRAAELLGRPVDGLKVVTCHLGAGASVAAVADGRSIDTTMGFTPLDGLMMATRSGSIDPGIIVWLQRYHGLTATQIEDALEHDSGLAAFSGSGDMRDVEAAAHANDPDATLALAVYNHRLVASIASMTATLGGLDALVFTGGIGENSPGVRTRAAEGLRFLGVELDDTRHAVVTGDMIVSSAQSAAQVLVIAAREDLEIARLVELTL